jgi:hypothetical protein
MKFHQNNRWEKNTSKSNSFDLSFLSFFSAVIISLILITAFSPIHSGFSNSGFTHSDYPPRPPEISTLDSMQIASDDNVAHSLQTLKAVLLVGPIDGNDGPWTKTEIANMELAATVLINQGVEVHKFYPGRGTIAEIEAAAEGAHFLLYRGHGVYDGKIPYPTVGGFYLSSGYYSPERIQTNLHLAPNAIVMLYGCFTAGSSSAPDDEIDIGITEASRRVAQYSAPFFKIGAAGYYANWYGNAFEAFLNNLFAGQTLGSAYENYFDFNSQTVYRTFHPDFPTFPMWVDKDKWGDPSYWQYNNAFVGLADKTLMDLFSPPTLGEFPENLRFFYSTTDQQFLNPAFDLHLKNTGDDQLIDWEAVTFESWIVVSPENGQTPNTISVSVANFDTTKSDNYAGTITFNGSIQGTPVNNSPITLPVTLTVSENPISRVYLPVLQK